MNVNEQAREEASGPCHHERREGSLGGHRCFASQILRYAQDDIPIVLVYIHHRAPTYVSQTELLRRQVLPCCYHSAQIATTRQ